MVHINPQSFLVTSLWGFRNLSFFYILEFYFWTMFKQLFNKSTNTVKPIFWSINKFPKNYIIFIIFSVSFHKVFHVKDKSHDLLYHYYGYRSIHYTFKLPLAAQLNDTRLAVPNISLPYSELHMDPREVFGEANSSSMVLDTRNLVSIFIYKKVVVFISKQAKEHRASIYHRNKAST